jgi:hypothetical protein
VGRTGEIVPPLLREPGLAHTGRHASDQVLTRAGHRAALLPGGWDAAASRWPGWPRRSRRCGQGGCPTVAAITAAQAPQARRGAVAYRLAARLRLPDTVTNGLAAPFSRPARSAVTLATLLFGITGVVLGISLNASIHKINHSAFRGRGQLQASGLGGKFATLTPGQAAAVGVAIRAQPGTLTYAAETDLLYSGGAGQGHGNIIEEVGYSAPVTVAVAGRPDLPLMIYVYDGDSSGLG